MQWAVLTGIQEAWQCVTKRQLDSNAPEIAAQRKWCIVWEILKTTTAIQALFLILAKMFQVWEIYYPIIMWPIIG